MRVTVDNPEHRLRYRVLLDGQDITNRCYGADDEAGWADCFALNDEGRKYAVAGEIVRERLTGNVELVDMLAVLFTEDTPCQ